MQKAVLRSLSPKIITLLEGAKNSAGKCEMRCSGHSAPISLRLLEGAKNSAASGRGEKVCSLGIIAYGRRISNKQSDKLLAAYMPVERARCTPSLNTYKITKRLASRILYFIGKLDQIGSCDSI